MSPRTPLGMRSNLKSWARQLRTDANALAERLDVDRAEVDSLNGLISRILDEGDNQLIAARSQLVEAERALLEFESDQDEDIDPDQAAKAFAKLRLRQRNQHELEVELEEISARIEAAELQEAEAKVDYERKANKQEEYRKKQVVQALLSDTAGVFDRISDAMRRYGRTDFQRALNASYARMINKSYQLEVADNFTVRATVQGRTRALSQSEKTALTLAFLSAVAGLAPQYRDIMRRAQLTDMGNIRVGGGESYPVVLDAPYSPFDRTYAGTITTAIGDLATQVVLTTSASPVEHLRRIERNVGKAYVLHMRTSSQSAPQGGFEDEVVNWAGRSSRYVTVDDSLNDAITTIEEA